MSNEITTHLSVALGSALIACIVAAIARHWGLFTLPPSQPPVKSAGMPYLYLTALFAFATFLLLEAVVVPYITWVSLCSGHIPCLISTIEKGWSTVFGICFTAACVVSLTLTHSYSINKAVWGNFSLYNIAVGSLSWLLSYPVMIAIGQTVATLVALSTDLPHKDQVAVQRLLHVQNHPFLLACTIAVLVTAVPIMEETLFRGLLQNSLRCLFPRSLAIVFSAAIFALFHFAPEQGVTNLEFLASLFTLACFLGFIYERQRSLWAPIALHSTFNAISIAAIFM